MAIDFSQSKLPQDPLVEKAFDALVADKTLPKEEKKLNLRAARLLAKSDNPDLDLIIVALLVNNRAPGLAQDYSQRVADIAEAISNRPMFVPTALDMTQPFANEILKLELSGAAAILREELPEIEMAFGLMPLAHVFAKAAKDPDADRIPDEIREFKAGVKDMLDGLRTIFEPVLGKSGEDRIEARFVADFNEIADLAREPHLVPPNPVQTPPKPKGPGL